MAYTILLRLNVSLAATIKTSCEQVFGHVGLDVRWAIEGHVCHGGERICRSAGTRRLLPRMRQTGTQIRFICLLHVTYYIAYL